ncbi:MAG: type II toxin-antitoxin system VapC family toxin [Blastocatellia bacterium]
MNELCVDANVIVKLVLPGEPYRRKAWQLVNDCLHNNVTLVAPPFFEVEVDSVIRKRVYEGKLTLAEAKKAYAGLDQIPVQPFSHPRLRQRTREIAEQFNQRAVYDASYAALAELRGYEFWTADKAFYDVVKVVLTFVKYLPDYP